MILYLMFIKIEAKEEMLIKIKAEGLATEFEHSAVFITKRTMSLKAVCQYQDPI